MEKVRDKYKKFKISKYRRFRFEKGLIGVSFNYEGNYAWFDLIDIIKDMEFEYLENKTNLDIEDKKEKIKKFLEKGGLKKLRVSRISGLTK